LRITTDVMVTYIMNGLNLGGLEDAPVKGRIPWWATTAREDLYVHSKGITGASDVLTAVAMGLTVQPDTETAAMFVHPSTHQEKAGINNILTNEGYTRYKRESIGEFGWPMLQLFCDFAQSTQKELSTDTTQRLVKLLDEWVVDQIEMMMFNNYNPDKRWRNGEKTKKTLRLRWMEPLENALTFERLATPLLPPGEFSGTETDALKIFDKLTKVKQGIFEKSGELCNYQTVADRAKYQNEKKKGEAVISPKLDNAWALFLSAGLKLRVTIWSRTEGHDDVQVMNNDGIIQDMWARDIRDNPDIIQQFDQVLMCRPRDGMLRAVQRYHPEWRRSHWSKLALVDPALIPAEYQSREDADMAHSVEEEDATCSMEEDEETESIDDEQPHVMWKKQQAQDGFEVTIRPQEILRFLENISGQLTFHIREFDHYFNTSTLVSVAVKIHVELGKAIDIQKEELSMDMKTFTARVTNPQYWNNKYIPTGYQIMPQLSNRVHVVWFLPRLETSHIRSFLQVDLTIWPKSMKGSLYVTHVTENRQVLLRDETYRVIAVNDVDAFAIMLLELHKSDYRFLRRDHPDEPKIDIRILKFNIRHPGADRNLSPAKFQRVVSVQTDRIIAAVSTFVDRTNCSGLQFDTYKSENYTYRFNSNSNKRMCLTISVQYDGAYSEITLEETT
jgi:hypothetical protein